MKLIKKILAKIGINIYNLYFIKQDLKKSINHIEVKIRLDIKEADNNDLLEIEQVLEEPFLSFHKKYLNLEGVCLVARSDNKIAGYIWHSVGRVFIAGKFIKSLSQKYACAYGGFVFPQYRGKRVFESLIEAQAITARKNNAEWLINFADFNNPAAYKAREKFGVTKKRIIIISLPILKPLVLGRLK